MMTTIRVVAGRAFGIRWLPVVLASLVSCNAFGQNYAISTLAGGGLPTNIPGTSANIGAQVNAVAIDAKGNVFIAAGGPYSVVLRLDAVTGLLTVVAGTGTSGFSGDGGLATSAQLSYPHGVAVDSAGNLYIADTGNNVIRMISNGVITTVAGNNMCCSSLGDGGPATSAQLSQPYSVAVDSASNLYVATLNRIRKISNGVITTVAGNGTGGFSGDGGPATSAEINIPEGVAVDSTGNLYVADYGNNRVRKVSNGVITTVAGNGTSGFSGDGGPATSAQLNTPMGVGVDGTGNVYVADWGNSRVRKVSNGVITTVAGNGTGYSSSGDGGPATSAAVSSPVGVVFDSAGNLYIGTSSDAFYLNPSIERVRKVSNGVITTIAGGGSSLGDGGQATSGQLDEPFAVAVDSAGNVYIADSFDNRIRKVSSGLITTVAGNGTSGFSGDGGPATSAELNDPTGVAVDSAGDLYISDNENGRVRKVSNGVITTVATGLSTATGLAVDSAGNLYIADSGDQRVLMVSNGVTTTIAGTGTSGFSGDGGPATSAQLAYPSDVAVDASGNVYISDGDNNRIRKVSNGVISTVVGSGGAGQNAGGYAGDNGPATSALLKSPAGIKVDSAGSLYILDAGNQRIRKVTNGVITTIAGNGTSGFIGDGGPATSAEFDFGFFVNLAVDSAGNIYVTDDANSRIRLLQPQKPIVTAVANAASDVLGSVAPGEIVTIYGSGLGPTQLTSATGSFGTQLAGTQVFFNGTPAPLTYSWGPAVSAIVPYEITAGSAQVTVAYQGSTSAAITVGVAPSAPGIFVWELLSSGKGQALVANQDGSINSPDTPARIGSVITLYATGEGQTSPGGVDGKIASVPAPKPILPVTVNIGGQSVQPQYAGGAPGEVAGVMQINVQVPSGVASGSAVPITVQVGSAVSQAGVTIAVAGN